MQIQNNRISQSPWKLRKQLPKIREKIIWVGKKNEVITKCKAIKPVAENCFPKV